MMTAPLVSVMTVTYNHGKYIRQCLESIMMQKTNFPFEVIVGEDCSTDDTRSVVREFEARYPDIIKPIYHEKNVGALRNVSEFCFPNLKGKYIAVCEGDDYWTDEYKLQKQVDFLEQHPECSFCYHEYNIANPNNELIVQRKATGKVVIYKPKDIFHLKIQLLTVVFRNCIDLRPDEMLRLKMSDIVLFARLSTYGGAANLGFLGANYRKHTGGIYTRMSAIEQYEQIITGLRLMKHYSIFTPEQKNEIGKEIIMRKKIFVMKFLRKYEILNCLKIAFA